MKTILTEDIYSYPQLGEAELEAAEDCEERLVSLLKEVRQFIPEAFLMHKLEEYDGTLHYKNAEIHFTREGLDFRVFKYEKEYRIHVDFSCFKHIDRQRLNQTLGHGCPNRIGVLTAKKINEWIDFYKQKYGELYKLNEEKGQEIAEFQSQLAKLPDVCYNDSSCKSGHIKRGGLIFSFHIGREYIHTNIELQVYKPSLETFLVLSANQYKTTTP